MTKRKKPPLRVDELQKLRDNGGLVCSGKLEWDKMRGMLKPSVVDGKRVYTYTCPNCHHRGTTADENYRAKCGRKLT